MKISDYLNESSISLNLEGGSKPEILDSLVKILAQSTSINDIEDIIKTLEERENLKTTGIGSGIAIPHCKSSEVDKVHIAIGLSKGGKDFQSLDQEPANLFFLLVAPENAGSEHLKAIAKIARLVRGTKVRQELLELTSSKEVLEYIKAKEETLK
jgi:fructose-specific phosphotransferase system IIA component